MFFPVHNWYKNNWGKLIRFSIFGFLIFLLFGQGIDLYGRQQEKVLIDDYNREFEKAVLWLKDNSNPDDIVLPEWTQGHQIVALADRRVVATSKVYPSEAKESAQRYKNIASFFFADSEIEALRAVEKYKINFIFVRKNFDWWTCRYIAKCNSASGTIVDRMLKGDKFNAFSEVYRTDNFLIFKIAESLERKLFAGFPEDYFFRIGDAVPKVNVQWDEEITRISGAILPHHLDFTRDFLADFFQRLAQNQQVDTFIILGPDHFNLSQSSITISNLSWQTPWGIVKPDVNVVRSLVNEGGAVIDNEINEREHSIKGLIPFIKYRFPRAQIVPLVFRDETSEEQIQEFSAILDNFIDNKSVILVSADFAHRFSLAKTREEDERSLETIKNFDFDEIKNMKADAKPALISLLSSMRKLGAVNVRVLKHTNNLELLKEGILESTKKSVSYLVSYFFITFGK